MSARGPQFFAALTTARTMCPPTIAALLMTTSVKEPKMILVSREGDFREIMRHRDIRITADLQTDEALLPLASALTSLPRFSPSQLPPTSAFHPPKSPHQWCQKRAKCAKNVTTSSHHQACPVTMEARERGWKWARNPGVFASCLVQARSVTTVKHRRDNWGSRI